MQLCYILFKHYVTGPIMASQGNLIGTNQFEVQWNLLESPKRDHSRPMVTVVYPSVTFLWFYEERPLHMKDHFCDFPLEGLS